MNRKIQLISIISFFTILSFGQDSSLKELAIEEFKKENYPKAIELLKSALKESPDDSEIYYYLGFFTHYNAYDSRPLAGYDSSYSEIVFKYLDKAIELNPNYGDAKYFYTAECGTAARRALKIGNNTGVKEFYERAFKKGGFPDWVIEFGKNILDLCDKNAILFTAGDFDLNICWYLQLCEFYRTDVSVIPLALLDRPWYAIKVKNGGLFTKVNMNISDEQLIDMHPYKWESLTISLDVPGNLKDKYKLNNEYKMDWVVEPDYSSNRFASKNIEGEPAKKRTYLSGQRAVLLSIIETNQWERPIFFCSGFSPYFLAGLNTNFQNCGLVSKLLPLNTINTEWEIDVKKLESIVFDANLKDYKSVIVSNQPRVSGSVGFYYPFTYYTLAKYYNSKGNSEMIDKLITEYENKLMIGFNKEIENRYLENLKNLKN